MSAEAAAEIPLDAGPAERIALAVARFGEDDVVERSIALLGGFNVGDDFLLLVGGAHAKGIIDGAPPLYWPEVWGARALLFVWKDTAKPAIVAGLGNQAWRVREMCAKVIATRGLDEPEPLRMLITDPNARVRIAAARALSEVGESADVDSIRRLFKDPDIEVRRGAGDALKRLEHRLGEKL